MHYPGTARTNASGYGLGLQACLLGSIDNGIAGAPYPHEGSLGAPDQLFNISSNGTIRNRGAVGSPGSCLGRATGGGDQVVQGFGPHEFCDQGWSIRHNHNPSHAHGHARQAGISASSSSSSTTTTTTVSLELKASPGMCLRCVCVCVCMCVWVCVYLCVYVCVCVCMCVYLCLCLCLCLCLYLYLCLCICLCSSEGEDVAAAADPWCAENNNMWRSNTDVLQCWGRTMMEAESVATQGTISKPGVCQPHIGTPFRLPFRHDATQSLS